ncbi:MAG: peptidase domain-containing ABC transporter [Bacteroidota bacterium]
MAFPFYKQLNVMDCGPTCLRMITKYFGKHYSTDYLRELTGYNKRGVSLLGLSEAAEKVGFRTSGIQVTYEMLEEEATLPCILHWKRNHFVVLIDHKKSNLFRKEYFVIADPAKGIVKIGLDEFIKFWQPAKKVDSSSVGSALLLEPTEAFHAAEGSPEHELTWKEILKYIGNNKWQITQILFALVLTSFLQLVFPFLTQSIVDVGINTQNISFIQLILVAQLMLVFSRTIVDFLRSRLLLGVSMIINMTILSEFWQKLARLPISYFESFQTGDTIQRIDDNKKIQSFLTGSALSTVFSSINLVIYSVVLLLYDSKLFLIILVGSSLYFFWIRIFLKIRRRLNYQSFSLSAEENGKTLQLIQGMREIKLSNAQAVKIREWEKVQTSIFKVGFKNLTYSQAQQAGALFITQGKDVVITFVVAKLVISGQLSLGAMLAIQFIIGQLNSPIEQLVTFIQNLQDAKISIERLNEIHELSDEENDRQTDSAPPNENSSIYLDDVSFSYPGSQQNTVIRNITLEIPAGKTLAIVGTSGSGKTTIIKLLLKFYDNYSGTIRIGETDLRALRPSFWRDQCGSVLQEGFIFSDSILHNISLGNDEPDLERAKRASETANIYSFIESLPNSFETVLGTNGIGLSQGQKQRILIARAIYKNPRFVFLDEATNALDSNNEKTIVKNLTDYFQGRTVVIIAHRLSTVKNADKIVVFDEGSIAEEGTHHQLLDRKGKYYELIKNQLELERK